MIESIERLLHELKLVFFDSVIKRAQKHLKNYPNDLRIRNNLAAAMALKGDGAQALKINDDDITPVT